jgi:hypothetical protein
MEYKVMGPDSLNPNVKNTVNTLTGELFLRASELQKEGKKVQELFSNPPPPPPFVGSPFQGRDIVMHPETMGQKFGIPTFMWSPL